MTVIETASTVNLRVAVIDDAFDPITWETLGQAFVQNFLNAVLSDPTLSYEWDDAEWAFTSSNEFSPEHFDLLRDPEGLGAKFVPLFATQLTAAEAEGDNVRKLAETLQDLGHSVTTYGVASSKESAESIAGNVDIAFLDFYLGPADKLSSVENSGQIAGALVGVQAEHRPFIVLMSSQLTEEETRAERISYFKGVAKDMPGCAFLFASKAFLSEDWQVEGYCKVARDAADVRNALETLLMKLKASANRAVDELFTAANDLELADWAYLQLLKLDSDGHPLGEYIAWLFSARLSYELFESDLRPEIRKLNGQRFRASIPSHSPPSKRVADMYESALFERGLGPLGPHPLSESQEEKAIPFILLGDIFAKPDATEVILIASADCDMAIAPGSSRMIPAGRSVLLIPGNVTKIGTSGGGDDARRTELFRIKNADYAIEWKFDKWRAMDIGTLHESLTKEGYDTSSYVRFRPQFGLAIQQGFHAAAARVGLPKAPPLFRHPVVRVFWNNKEHGLSEISVIKKGVSIVRGRLPGEKGENEFLQISIPVANTLKQALASNLESERVGTVSRSWGTQLTKIEQAISPASHPKWAKLVDRQFKIPGPRGIGPFLADLPIRIGTNVEVGSTHKEAFLLLNIEP